jgi:hypothetical protein
MAGPEDVEQVVVRDLLGVELDENGLGVPGASGADALVGWVIGGAARISDFRRDDSRGVAELRLDAPESPGCKDRKIVPMGPCVGESSRLRAHSRRRLVAACEHGGQTGQREGK